MKIKLICLVWCLIANTTTQAQSDITNRFAKGADVGFLTEQECRGIKFHDRVGGERECLELLKNDYQINSIRMRVWVNPRRGNCDKHTLLAIAKRVKALNMDLMVDFHYSDSWADPGKNLDTLLKYGGKFDMIGMSLYPYWAMEGHPELKADDIITDCIDNIRHVSEKYKCDVMIVETGYEVDEQHPEIMEEGRKQLARVISEARYKTGGRCCGVFYWEPQCLPGGYKLGAFDSNAAPTVIMDGFIEEK